MVRYIYYDPATMEVEAIFETPVLSVQANWAARGLARATLTDDQEVKHRSIVEIKARAVTSISEPRRNRSNN